jgi:hypothetical protein
MVWDYKIYKLWYFHRLASRANARATPLVEKYLFNNLDLLICYDKEDMVKDHDLGDMDLRA